MARPKLPRAQTSKGALNKEARVFIKTLAKGQPLTLLLAEFCPASSFEDAMTLLEYARKKHDVQLHFTREGYSFWVRLEGSLATVTKCRAEQLAFGPDIARVITTGVLQLRRHHTNEQRHANAERLHE